MISQDPTRIFVVISKKSVHWQQGWSEPTAVIKAALETINSQPDLDASIPPDVSAMLVAVERWDIRTYVVFDVFNKLYDPVTAHIAGKNDLPVITVYFSTKEKAAIAGRPMENEVNSKLRAVHNSYGPGSQPPFFVDHAEGAVPYYPNPRSSCQSPA